MNITPTSHIKYSRTLLCTTLLCIFSICTSAQSNLSDDSNSRMRDALPNSSGSVQQKNTYYAFGGLMSDQCTGFDVQPYRFQGKELDRTHGLEWNDHGARFADLLTAIPLNSIANLNNGKLVTFEIANKATAEKVNNSVRNYSDVEWTMIQHGKKNSTTLLNEYSPTSVDASLLSKYEKEDGKGIK